MDLGLQVKGVKGVRESLEQLFEKERFEGDNQLTCDSDVCKGKKTDSTKGIEIEKLPPVLTLCLYRFELDYETWQRKKLNDKFEYPLELDMSEFVSETCKKQTQSSKDHEEQDFIYELKSIIIHRGGAYGGHYYAYVKDDLKEGNWYLEKHSDFQKDPQEVVQKKYNPQDFMTEEQKADLEKEKNKNNPKGNKKKNKQKKEKEVVT